MTPTPIDTLAILRSAALSDEQHTWPCPVHGYTYGMDGECQKCVVAVLRAEVARLRAELQNTVTTAYHDEIVRYAVAERLALRDAVTVAIHACTDVTRLGRFAPAVDPVRWVAQLEAHLRDAVKA